jgi:hypothetical protein
MQTFLDALPLAKEEQLDSAVHSTEPQPVAVPGQVLASTHT